MKKKVPSQLSIEDKEQQYRIIFEAASDGMIISDLVCEVDSKARYVYLNSQYEQILGYTPEELLGKPVRKFIHPDDLKQSSSSFLKFSNEIATSRNEWRFLHKNGEWRWFDCIANRYKKPSGDVRVVVISRDITDRKRIENELNQAHELLETVTKGTQVIIAAVDMNFCYTYFNTAYAEEIMRLTGKPLRFGMNMVELFTEMPDQQKIVVEEWSQALRGESKVNTLEFGSAQRYRRTYNVLHTPIRDAEGKVVGAGEVAHDITQQVQVDELLRQSEARYRSLFTSMNEGFALCEIICDDGGVPCAFRFLEVNAAFEKQTGIRVADILGKTIRERFPDIEMSWIENYGKVALTGESARFENYNHNTSRYYEVFSFSPAKGKFAMLFMDISEHKQAEAELRESRAVLQAILDSAQDPIYIKDRQSRIVMANPAVAKVVGRPLNEILGKTDSEFYGDPAIGQALRDNDLRIMTTGQGEVVEETVLTPAGHRIFLSSKTPHHNASGETIGIIGISHDITERKKAEKIQAWLASFPRLNPSPIVEVDFSGKLHYLNPTAQRLFPDLQEKGMGHPWLHDLETIVAEFLQGDTDPKTTGRDVQIGEATYQQIISCVAENQRVRIYGFDITARIKAEEALRQARDELEIRIQERTQELKQTNEQLQAEIVERQHLAQNLHDAVNQSLFSAGLIAEVLPRLWERDQESARRSLEDLRRLTRGAQAEMRALLSELRPSTLTDAELGDLLRLLGNAFSGRTNIPVTVTINGEGSLPAETQVALYRICQEALNNVAKHAGASLVEINLKHEDTSIEISINDDGQGFYPERIAAGHYGLSMMRERAEAVGALLSITSQLGHGTELTIRWTEAEKKEAL